MEKKLTYPVKYPLKFKGCAIAALVCLVVAGSGICYAAESPGVDFLEAVFEKSVPAPEYIWITPAVRAVAESIPGHGLRGPRIKYWRKDARTVWILSDMAKDTPVCAAIVVSRSKIQKLEILSAQGRWGSLVQNENFTAQFKGAAADVDNRLNQTIDGITGATMSVDAVSGLARLALALDGLINTE